MLNKLWERTKEVASMYTGTFIVVMILNQLLFFGFCLNPICLIAAMPHVLFITVIIGTWLNHQKAKNKKQEYDELNTSIDKLTKTTIPSHSDKPVNIDKLLEKKLDQIIKVSSPDKNDIGPSANTLDFKEHRNARLNKKNKLVKKLVTKSKNITPVSRKISTFNKTIEDLKKSQRESLKFQDEAKKLDKLNDELLNVVSIKINLTPETYLSNEQLKTRKSLIFSGSTGIALDHDINNQFDQLAIKVSSKGIYIGHVDKGKNDREIESFCFDNGQLKRNIGIVWGNGGLLIQQKSAVNNVTEKNILGNYGVKSLWHMTHIDNLKGILNHGILSHHIAHDKFKPVDISDHSVQRYRTNSEPIFNRKIHDYAPMYFSIKNPMLFTRKGMSSQICILEVRTDVMRETQSLFTDGNAASRDTTFFSKMDDLSKLPWDVIHADYWGDFVDGKRKKCAEVLIYRHIESKYIKTVHCSCFQTKQQIERNMAIEFPVKITPSLFF